jgi:multisubunit Na+/H+ antiporter MnhC subunit
MTAAAMPLETLLAAAAIALVVIGATAALLLTNAIKRIVGLTIASFGATFGLAALSAPDSALVASVAVVFAQAVVGVVIVVRLQESYGTIEAVEIDSADRDDDAQEHAQ